MDFSAALLPSIVLLLLFFLKPRRPSTSSTTNFTPLRSYPLIRNLPHLISNRRRMLEWASELIPLSPTATATVAPFVFTANPANLEHMLRSNFDNYLKGGFVTPTLRDFLGDGIFNSNGELWRLQRKTASFEFNTKSIRGFIIDIVSREVADRLLPLLRGACAAGEVVDLQELLERFAFDNVCNLAFGYEPQCLAGESEEGVRFFHAFHEASHLVVERTTTSVPFSWIIKKMLNVGSERRFKTSLAIVHEMTSRFVQWRRKEAGAAGREDLLSRFANEPNISNELLRDICVNFILAGGDTTPSALTWFFWLISSKRHIVEHIVNEIKVTRARTKSTNEVLGLDELREMHYLHAALSESLRLYPPVPLLPRWAAAEDVLPDGTTVKRGWFLAYSAYEMGRTESIWGEDCGEMRPERWLEEGVYRPASPFKYPVFHAGPRACLGKEMAYIQMKTVAACILERFEVEVAAERGEPELAMTMRMKGGLPVRVRERGEARVRRV